MAQQAQMSPAQMAQANSQLRQALISTGLWSRKNLITVTSANALTSRIKLFNVGILTKLQLVVSAALTIGTAVAVPSTKAPWNLISRIRLTDYDNTDRVNVSGFQLFVLNCVRKQAFWGYNNSAANGTGYGITTPSVPTAVANGTMSFIIDIPVAFDAENSIVQLRDLRGAMMMQTAVGEVYLNIDWVSSLYANGDIESLYSGAATTTVVGNGATFITCTVYQEFILPQAIPGGGLPIPSIDLNTVYEINGNIRASDNLSQNQERLISYPNVRSVIGAYVNFINNAALTNAISNMRILANGNTVLIDHSALTKLFEQRAWCDYNDIIPGVFFFQHRAKPIETALFGNVQIGMTPNVALTNPNIEYMWESFYSKGAALPGIGQAQ